MTVNVGDRVPVGIWGGTYHAEVTKVGRKLFTGRFRAKNGRMYDRKFRIEPVRTRVTDHRGSVGTAEVTFHPQA